MAHIRADPTPLISLFPVYYLQQPQQPQQPPPPQKEETREAWLDEQVCCQLANEYQSSSCASSATSSSPTGLPLNFDRQEDEIGLVFLGEALRFGSMYDAALLASCKRNSSSSTPSRDLVQFGVLGSFISSKSLHLADNMLAICNDPYAIGTTFDFPTYKNEQLDFAKLGGVYKEVPGPLYPFAERLGKSLNEMAMLCRSRGVDSLGDLALLLLMSSSSSSSSIQDYADKLAKAMPYTFGGDEPFQCKAVRLALALAARFPSRFPLVNNQAAAVDPELVLSLRKLGAIKLGQALLKDVDAGMVLLSKDKSNMLRALAKQAVEQVAGGGGGRADLTADWAVDKAALVSLTYRQHVSDTVAF